METQKGTWKKTNSFRFSIQEEYIPSKNVLSRITVSNYIESYRLINRAKCRTQAPRTNREIKVTSLVVRRNRPGQIIQLITNRSTMENPNSPGGG